MTIHFLTAANELEGSVIAKRTRAYADGLGLDLTDRNSVRWHQPRLDDHFAEVLPIEAGEPLWAGLEAGDVVVAATLAELGHSPVHVRQTLDRLMKAGASCYVADLGPQALNTRLGEVKAWARLELSTADRLAQSNARLRGLETELSAQFDRQLAAAVRLAGEKLDVIQSVMAGMPGFRGKCLNGSGERYGASVKARREALGMSQKELAEKVGVDPGTISRLESKGSAECVSKVHEILWGGEG